MKEHTDVYLVTGNESILCKQNDQHGQCGESILDVNKLPGPIVQIKPHNRIELFSPLRQQDQCQQGIQETQNQYYYYAYNQGWFISIENNDAISVTGAS